jgi:hypothetical protein
VPAELCRFLHFLRHGYHTPAVSKLRQARVGHGVDAIVLQDRFCTIGRGQMRQQADAIAVLKSADTGTERITATMIVAQDDGQTAPRIC